MMGQQECQPPRRVLGGGDGQAQEGGKKHEPGRRDSMCENLESRKHLPPSRKRKELVW